jgi:hypothetical protein
MANEKKGGAGIRYDDFVKIVKPDPGSTEQVVLLHGYVGASVTDDKIRLYSDASLMEYADIAKADVVYSLPNNDDPLGGSRLWVKQSANVNYADAQGYAQGDMYNSYMNDQYSPGAEAMGPTVTLACTIAPLTRNPVCRPTRFICPTPVSRLVICTLPPRTRLGCPQPTLAACPQPSWVDACPSQWGCTIQTGTTVINPGTGGAQFGADYTGGDVYNDYMQNSYEGGTEGFGPLPTTTIQTTVQPTIVTIRPTSPIICRRTIRIWDCWRPTRQAWCPPITCQLGSIRPTTFPSIACATDITRTQTIQTGTTVINPGTGGAQFGADYTGGDMYNDYMQNSYEGTGTEAFGPAPTITGPQQCLQLTHVGCQATSPIRCRFSVPVFRCITQQRHRSICIPCQITTTRTIQTTTVGTIGTIRTQTFPSAVDGCPSQFGCATDFTRTINPDTINPGGFGGYYDYGY